MADAELVNTHSDGDPRSIKDFRPGSPQHATWARAYWVVLVNQIMVIGLLTLVGRVMVRDSHQIGVQAFEASNFDWPKLSSMYLGDGPVELAIAGFVSVSVSLAAVGLRRRSTGTIVASLSFAICVIYMTVGMLASNLLLKKALMHMLTLEE